MGQLKFEKKFREKLNEREIEPKSKSWEELSARLDSEEKSKNPIFWWIGIAASIVGGIFILSLAFINDPVAESNNLVDKPSEEILKDPYNKPTEETLVASEETEKAAISEKAAKNSEGKNTAVQNSGFTTNKGSGTSLASAEKKKNVIKEDLVFASKEAPEVDTGSSVLEEGVAELSYEENKSGEVTNAEVDALLAEASSQLNKSRTQKAFSEKITANDLLWDVEMELEASFREKVFEVVKDGFIKARTAVANRNN